MKCRARGRKKVKQKYTFRSQILVRLGSLDNSRLALIGTLYLALSSTRLLYICLSDVLIRKCRNLEGFFCLPLPLPLSTKTLHCTSYQPPLQVKPSEILDHPNMEALLPTMADLNRKSNSNMIMAVPQEIRFMIYDHVETHCADQQLENQLVRDGYISVTFGNMHLVKEWIIKRVITTESMGKVDRHHKENIEKYNTLKRPERLIPQDNITLRFMWMKQLGQLLLDVGHVGRQKITSLELVWNELSFNPRCYTFNSLWHR